MHAKRNGEALKGGMSHTDHSLHSSLPHLLRQEDFLLVQEQPGQQDATTWPRRRCPNLEHSPPKNVCSEQPLPCPFSLLPEPSCALFSGLACGSPQSVCHVLRFFYYSGVNLILLAKLLTFFLVKVDKTHYLFTSNKSRVFHILFLTIRLFALEDESLDL